MWNKYYLAANLIDAMTLLDQQPEQSMIIAGGTDLVLEIKREIRPEITTLIDISRISGLDSIRYDEKGNIHIGALVTHNQVATSPIIRKQARCLAEAAIQVGSPQIRNRGTLVGNLVTASPANDTITALIALKAQLILVSTEKERTVPVEEFYSGVRKTIKQKKEIVKEIVIESRVSEYVTTFYKFALRNAQAISVVNLAVAMKVQHLRVQDIIITAGAVAPTVVRLKDIEKKVLGMPLSYLESISFQVDSEAIKPITDIRASAEFRREMVGVILKRCFDALIHPEKTYNHIPENPVILSDNGSIRKRTELQQTILIDENNPIQTKINGQEYTFSACFQKSLLDLIREDAGLIGSKEGCAEGECGACTIYLDGRAVMSCLVPAPRAHLSEITTIEGISMGDEFHPVQRAFIEEGAVQCGYCTPGFIMSAVKLLEEKPDPSEIEIRDALTGNLCRCTGYYKIIKAIEKAAGAGGLHGKT